MESSARTSAGIFAGVAVASCLVLVAGSAWAALVRGGGNRSTDCIAVFDAPGANKPAPPKVARNVDCTDGDPSCDADGARNGICVFDLQVCLNSDGFVAECTPEEVDSVTVEHAEDNGDPKFDPDFQAIQLRLNLLEMPNNQNLNDCTVVSSITVALKGPNSSNKMRAGRKRLKVSADGRASGRNKIDRDRLRLKCRPEGDRIYLPVDLFDSTFDRITQQVFAPSCALSACHDDQSNAGGMNLLPINAFAQIVGVVPMNLAAAGDGLFRIDAVGDFNNSLLYRKITGNLPAGYGGRMPLGMPSLDPNLIELIRLWIVGDAVTGPAPQTGWVTGTTGQ